MHPAGFRLTLVLLLQCAAGAASMESASTSSSAYADDTWDIPGVDFSAGGDLEEGQGEDAGYGKS
jgi:hypothetical protein